MIGTLLRIELARSCRRPLHRGLLVVIAVLPLLLLPLAGGADTSASGGLDAAAAAFGSARISGFNFVAAVLAITVDVILLLLAALVGGDSVASEAGWGTLRTTLTAPVARHRLVVSKFFVSTIVVAASVVVMGLVALVAGAAAFGAGAMVGPELSVLDPTTALSRIALAVGFVVLTRLPIVALGVLFSAVTFSSAAAVAGTSGAFVAMQLLEMLPSSPPLLGALPTHYVADFLVLFETKPDYASFTAAIGIQLAWATFFVAVAASWLRRVDVTI